MKVESYFNSLNTKLSWLCFFFLYWLFPCCSQLSKLIKKNLIILEFPKNMIKPPLLWLMFLTLQYNVRIILHLMKSNVLLLNVLHKNYKKATFYVSESILTPFSPFDIKCKKRNVKNLCPGEWVFHIFQKFH